MTITVKDFIEWMKQFPEDTEVGVLSKNDTDTHYECEHQFVNAVDEIPHEFKDFTTNQFVKESDPHFNSKYLELGRNWGLSGD